MCRLRIKGMACTSCSESVEQALQMVSGVKKAVVGLALEEAKVHFDSSLTDTDRIIEAIEDAGFGATLISSGNDLNKVHLKIEGVYSLEDANVIKSCLESVSGVNHVTIDMVEHKVTISYDPDFTGPRSLIKCIHEAGGSLNSYSASLYIPPREKEQEQTQEIRIYRNQFFFSCLFSVPIFMISMVLPMIPPYDNWLNYKIHNMLTLGMILSWILCTPVQFIVGRRYWFYIFTHIYVVFSTSRPEPKRISQNNVVNFFICLEPILFSSCVVFRFYVGSYHALRRRSANMDVLVAMGTNAAYFYSVYVVIKTLTSETFHGQEFFETSAMLISFILLGKYLEVVAKGKTSDALAKLADLAPDTACLLTIDANGNFISEMEINTQLIQRNDIIKIVPGAKVPVDGVVIDGQSHVNESMITGEARPIAKRTGDKVLLVKFWSTMHTCIKGIMGLK